MIRASSWRLPEAPSPVESALPRCMFLKAKVFLTLATLFPSLPGDSSFWALLKAFCSTGQCPTCCHLLSQPTVHSRLRHRLQLELVKYLLGVLKVEIFCSLWPVNGNETCKTTHPLRDEGKEQKGAKKSPCFLLSKYCMRWCFLQCNLSHQCAKMLFLS